MNKLIKYDLIRQTNIISVLVRDQWIYCIAHCRVFVLFCHEFKWESSGEVMISGYIVILFSFLVYRF